MKIEAEVHPVGSERYMVDLTFDVVKVRVSSIRIHIDERWPDEIQVRHGLVFVALVESRHDYTRNHVTWNDLEFADLFDTPEQATARRNERIKEWHARQEPTE